MGVEPTLKIFDYRVVDKADEYEDIPILDAGPYLAGEPGAAQALAENIRFIQETIGFYVIVNHGVPRELMDNAYSALKRFFARPSEEKLKLKFGEKSVGYVAAKSTVYVTSKINENTKQDLNETLVLALERSSDHPYLEQGLRFVGPNPWPENLPGFREPIVEFQQAIAALGRKMVPLYALALEKPADFFDKYFEEPIMWTRNSHYPAVEPEENQFGISPHSDHSFLTLLPLSDVPGLQVLTRTGKWLPADPVANGIIVNTGEFLNRWTNDRFIASPHRVVPPDHDRYSMATFFNPAPDTVADTLDTCTSADNPPKYDPVTMMDYVCWYIDRNYSTEFGGQQEGITA
ncbi:MAG: isopenicillin N synthase family oxygenase [Alphaproteobacteria bacterium]|nr:isopenicillin N synthase family oxygenase [Alphaproteobacteria bacterium]